MAETKRGFRYAIYTRQSADTTADFSSCEAQFAVRQDFAKGSGEANLHWCGQRFDDEGRSGATLDRPLARLDKTTVHGRWRNRNRIHEMWVNLSVTPRVTSAPPLETLKLSALAVYTPIWFTRGYVRSPVTTRTFFPEGERTQGRHYQHLPCTACLARVPHRMQPENTIDAAQRPVSRSSSSEHRAPCTVTVEAASWALDTTTLRSACWSADSTISPAS